MSEGTGVQYINTSQAFAGSVLIGKFALDESEYEPLLTVEKNHTILKPYLIGDDINNDPNHTPSRYVIDFKGCSLQEARKWPELLEIIETKVLPERLKNNRKTYRDKWWLFAENAKQLYELIQTRQYCLVVAKTTKYISFVRIEPKSIVLDQSLTVVIDGTYPKFAVLQSAIHELWARYYGTTHDTRARYNNTNCYETFPFPKSSNNSQYLSLEMYGRRLYEARKDVLQMMKLGLTKSYNLYHNPKLTSTIVAKESRQSECIAERAYHGLLTLRHLHKEMDYAVLAAYGWTDLDLEHGFHEVEYLPENDRFRYTISEKARKELLRRLLKLNHDIHDEEVKNRLWIEKKSAKRKGGAIDTNTNDLF